MTTKKKPTALSKVVETIRDERPVADITIGQYERSVRFFGKFLGHKATTADLFEQNVNKWVKHLETEGKSGATIHNYRRGLLVVWNIAARDYLCDPYANCRLRKSRVDRKMVPIFTPAQVLAIEKAADEICVLSCYSRPRTMSADPEVYCGAYVRVQMDTLFRPIDMRGLRWSHINGNIITIEQHKTGVTVSRPLRDVTVKALERLRKCRETPKGNLTGKEFIFSLSSRGWYRWERRIRAAAGCDTLRMGLGKLRHAGATAIYRAHGLEAASQSLGHVLGSQVAAKHYIQHDATKTAPLPNYLPNAEGDTP